MHHLNVLKNMLYDWGYFVLEIIVTDCTHSSEYTLGLSSQSGQHHTTVL